MSGKFVRSVGVAAAAMLAMGSAALLAAPAEAKGNDGRVEKRGTCSKGGTWKLKAKHDDNRIEWEFEVDTNRVGQKWSVKVTDNKTRVFTGTRTTTAPSGSFSVEKKTANRAGKDVIKARATRGKNVCAGTVSV